MLPATAYPHGCRTAVGSTGSQGSIGNDLTKEEVAEVIRAGQVWGQKPQAPAGSLAKNIGQVLGTLTQILG